MVPLEVFWQQVANDICAKLPDDRHIKGYMKDKVEASEGQHRRERLIMQSPFIYLHLLTFNI